MDRRDLIHIGINYNESKVAVVISGQRLDFNRSDSRERVISNLIVDLFILLGRKYGTPSGGHFGEFKEYYTIPITSEIHNFIIRFLKALTYYYDGKWDVNTTTDFLKYVIDLVRDSTSLKDFNDIVKALNIYVELLDIDN